MANISLKLSGFEEAYRVMDELPRRVRTSVMRKALVAAATLLRKEFRSAVGVHTGNLRKSLFRRVSARSAVRESFAEVGFRAPHAHLYEYGTQERSYTTKSGKVHRTGRMPASRFATKAFERMRAAMIAAIARVLREELESRSGAAYRLGRRLG